MRTVNWQQREATSVEDIGSTNIEAVLAAASEAAVGTARKTAAAADDYVHDRPWTVIGVTAAAGILIGFLAAKR